MDPPASSPQAAPPAYAESASDPHWKIRNTKYSSVFATNGPPSVEDYRTHAKHIKDSFLECGVVGPQDNKARRIELTTSRAPAVLFLVLIVLLKSNPAKLFPTSNSLYANIRKFYIPSNH
jgi:hypothetical protein